MIVILIFKEEYLLWFDYIELLIFKDTTWFPALAGTNSLLFSLTYMETLLFKLHSPQNACQLQRRRPAEGSIATARRDSQAQNGRDGGQSF